MPIYYVNNDPTHNPGLHHEVHTEEHANELRIRRQSILGYYSSCYEAKRKAKETYSDADGCAICCPLATRVMICLEKNITLFMIPTEVGM